MGQTRRDVLVKFGTIALMAPVLGSSIACGKSRPNPAEPNKDKFTSKDRTDWMAGKWGLMTHWIAPGPYPASGAHITDLNTAVNNFDVSRLVSQIKESGASFLLFTIGQNTGGYCSPNSVMEKLAGSGHCSDRDLMLEIATALRVEDIGLICYIPGEINAVTSLHDAFAWRPGDQREFEIRYTDFVKEYALRLGDLCQGWWYDGCYDWPEFPNAQRDFNLWLDAARAGNPKRAVAFNNGCFYSSTPRPTTLFEDYLSGECWGIRDGQIVIGHDQTTDYLYLPDNRFIKNTNVHFHVQFPIDLAGGWTYLGPDRMPAPRFVDNQLFSVVKNVLSVGGTVTMNAGIYQEGFISDDTLKQLMRLKNFLKV